MVKIAMPWRCYMAKAVRVPDSEEFVDGSGTKWGTYFEVDGKKLSHAELKIGAVYVSEYDGLLYIKIPGFNGRNEFSPQRTYTNGAKWTMTGQPPNITCSPSINDVRRLARPYREWICERGRVALRRLW
jgi:hypothetical protein